MLVPPLFELRDVGQDVLVEALVLDFVGGFDLQILRTQVGYLSVVSRKHNLFELPELYHLVDNFHFVQHFAVLQSESRQGSSQEGLHPDYKDRVSLVVSEQWLG